MEFVNDKGAGAPQNAPTQEADNSLPTRIEACEPMEQDNRDQTTEALSKSGNDEVIQPSNAPIKKHEVRMSGAARKRFKYLLSKGIPKKEAREQALTPMNKGNGTTGKGSKSVQPEGGILDSLQRSKGIPKKEAREQAFTPMNKGNEITDKRSKSVQPEGGILEGQSQKSAESHGDGKTVDKTSTVSTKPSFSQTVEGKKVGIIPADYPDSLLTTHQMRATQEAIMDKIVDLETEAEARPQFLSSHYRPGWLTLVCANEATITWLKNIIEEIKPWEGASLRVIENDDLPHAEILVAYLPGSLDYSNEKILKLIERQNDGLETKNWRVLKRTEEGYSVLLTFSVDEQSAAKIKEKGYRVSYKFGQVQIRLRGSNPKRPMTNFGSFKGPHSSASSSSREYTVTKRQIPKMMGRGQHRITSKVRGKPQEPFGPRKGRGIIMGYKRGPIKYPSSNQTTM